MSTPEPSDPPQATDPSSTRLELVIPADPRMLRVLRLVASGVASLGAFDLESVEEVRVAVDELGSTLISASNGAAVALTFSMGADGLTVEGSTDLADHDFDLDPLTHRMLDVVASSHSWSSADGVGHGRVEKHLPST
jgi:serine/threonine-protein kinase RsbW